MPSSRVPDWFIKELQVHQARVSITVSAVRNQGPGTTRAVRAFLKDELDLADMRANSQPAYLRRLDSATDALRRRLKGKARTFGLARKLLNVLIRDCVYSRFLCAHYRLEPIESFLELPLDGIVGQRLVEAARKQGLRGRLPRWHSIRSLTRPQSDEYQKFAMDLANERGLARVHLDVILWGAREQADAGRRMSDSGV
jgi:N-glycosylase/DNA lyase